MSEYRLLSPKKTSDLNKHSFKTNKTVDFEEAQQVNISNLFMETQTIEDRPLHTKHSNAKTASSRISSFLRPDRLSLPIS